MKRAVICSLLVFLFLSTAPAQTTTATLLGTVRDTSGAVIPQTSVTATNHGTNLRITAMTDGAGNFVLPNLPPGMYRLRMEKRGFRGLDVASVLLTSAASVRHDATLEPGAVEQSVNVTASVPVVTTDASGVTSRMDSRQIVSFPLNGRTLDRLIQFTAGNVGTNAGQPAIGGAPRIGGAFWTVDGIPYQDVALGRAVPTSDFGLGQFPSIDSIEELKIESALAKAEYDGPVPVSLITKSGTNEFHGTAFWFNRNREFAARPFFLSPASPKPVFNRNEFGGVLGGPLWKDHTFFQFSYEGMRRRTARSIALSVATAAMRAGDFSGLGAIRDPLSGVNFPNNRIPESRLDPRTVSLQQFIPLPNATGTGAAGTGVNYFDVVGQKIDHDRPSLRVDHFLADKHRLTVNLNYANSSPTFLAVGTPPNYGNLADNGRRTKTGSLGLNSAISPSLLNEFRYAYFMNMEFFQGQNKDFNPSTIIPGLYQPLSIGGLPTVSVAGFQGLSDYGGAEGLAPQITNQFSNNVTKIAGRHALKAGGDFALVRQSRPPNTEAPSFGQFSFNGRYTGNAYGDFLLGFPVSSARARPSLVSLLHYQRYSAFLQDDWKVTSRLTLNLGLRYVGQTGPEERDGSQSNFDLATGRFVVRSVAGAAPPLSIGRLLDAYPIGKSEDIGWGSTLISGDNDNFAPRFGFAFRPFRDNRTVIRGGYGLYYILAYHGYGLFGTFFANPPFFLSESFEAAAGNTPSLSLANPFPGTGAISANPRVLAVQRNLELGYTQQWNLTVERELLANVGLRLSYVGNKGNNLHRSQTNWNLPRVQRPGTIQSQRPYQPWGDIPALTFDGQSITHQLQVELTQRYRNGLQFQTSYTWNRTLDNVPSAGLTQNPYDYAMDRGDADGIRHHAFYAAAVYDLPFGSGQRYLNSSQAWSKYLTGGWTVSTAIQAMSGSPFSVTFNPTEAGWYATRADVVAGASLYPADRTADRWFDPAAFRVPQAFTFGNSARNILFGPGLRNVDLSLFKNVPLSESWRLQFRAEAFNLPNSLSLGNPSANISFPQNVGIIRSAQNTERNLQFGLKLLF